VNILDPLVAIGVLSNAIKLGDLLLTSEQQKKVQEAAENITLWLDYTRPLNWVIQWLTVNNGRGFVFFTVGSIVILNIVQIFMGKGVFGDVVLSNLPARFHFAAKVFGLLICVGVVPVLTFRFGVRAIQWLIAGGQMKHLFRRYIVSVFAGALATGILYAAVFALLRVILFFIPGIDGPSVSKALSAMLMFPVFETTMTITMVPGLAIACLYGLLPLELLFALLRGLAWRVVRYGKGAWAGLLLVVTAVLGIWDALVKTHSISPP
jgi:hypothetical protein